MSVCQFSVHVRCQSLGQVRGQSIEPTTAKRCLLSSTVPFHQSQNNIVFKEHGVVGCPMVGVQDYIINIAVWLKKIGLPRMHTGREDDSSSCAKARSRDDK